MIPSRNRVVARVLAIILPLAILASCTLSNAQLASSAGEDTDQRFPASPLVIESQGKRFTFEVELAQTPEQRRKGLMFRLNLPADHGMLFDFEKPNTVVMWMKNTYISLDMIFIDDTGLVVKIATDTNPHSLEPISSGAPVRAVLEINGGLSGRLGLGVGDCIVHDVFAGVLDKCSGPARP